MRDTDASPQWCSDHWNRVLADRTINGVMATLLLMQAFLDSAAIMLEARTMYGRQEGRIPTDVMNTVLDRHAPLCCWLGEEEFSVLIGQARMPREKTT